ncbi:MAG: S41 family peptidase [bacterium]|jgi:carboxyl-terminal processing protease|nr:S41 family peptidase [candidate division KSB1 bacterium]MDH7558993.1 S41 family peptidase [bacterium]
MSTKKQILLIVALILVTVGVSGWLSTVVGNRGPDYNEGLRRSILLFSNVYESVVQRYIEEVDPEKCVQAAIDGMLERLDPYTVYRKAEEDDEIEILTSGKYGGVGMRIGMRNGWATVVEQPFDGKPAFRAGIREGDQIIEVDGKSTKDLTISETASLLRGEPDTEVVVKIRREGVSEVLTFRLIRDVITVEDINCATIINGDVGFVRLTRFGRNAGTEVERAVSKLKQQGAKKLILDLRSNPGGLLEAAVEVANVFVPKGELIVSTKGRNKSDDREYRASKDPVWGDLPLAVLVDSYSASASEIVAGAIQDLDRGVVIGSTTFGKGLVQRVVGVGPRSTLRITTSEYFVPSGRLIQNPAVFDKGRTSVLYAEGIKRLEEAADPKKEYRTTSGRLVRGGGGIVPDIQVSPDTLSRLEFALLSQSMFFNFAVGYVQRHPDLPRDFVADDKVVDEFRKFLAEKKFEYKTDGETELEAFERAARKRGYLSDVTPALEQIKAALAQQKKREFEESLSYIRQSLEREIITKLWGTAAGISAVLDDDEVVQKAVEVLSNPLQYGSILGKKTTVGG